MDLCDGLSDGDELQRGSDPLKADSDGDGLSDAAELNGTLFTYNEFVTVAAR